MTTLQPSYMHDLGLAGATVPSSNFCDNIVHGTQLRQHYKGARVRRQKLLVAASLAN